jgi:uncharacterized membrane-anchored protein
MTATHKALLLAGLHLALVLSLGGKLLFDRATRPRYWLKAAPVDPDLPIRGRYVRLRVEVPVVGATLPALEPRPKHVKETDPWPPRWRRHALRVRLEPNGQELVARAQGTPNPQHIVLYDSRNNATLPERMRDLPESAWVVELNDAVPFFIPEHVPDPSRRENGEELWVEVTLPKKGPVRPIRLGVKKDGKLTVLNL